MLRPDAVITVGGQTQTFIQAWSIKPIKQGVTLTVAQRTAWDLVNPLYPPGYCNSGIRSIDEQRDLLHSNFLKIRKSEILELIDKKEYEELSKDLVANEARVVALVNQSGQAIAAPGHSEHELGKAIDTNGAQPLRREAVARMVARANPQIFTGYVLNEKNGCTPIEIRWAARVSPRFPAPIKIYRPHPTATAFRLALQPVAGPPQCRRVDCHRRF